MNVAITYERLEPTTSIGEGLKVTYTYSSFDKAEIDAMESVYDDAYKNGTIMEVNADEDSD